MTDKVTDKVTEAACSALVATARRGAASRGGADRRERGRGEPLQVVDEALLRVEVLAPQRLRLVARGLEDTQLSLHGEWRRVVARRRGGERREEAGRGKKEAGGGEGGGGEGGGGEGRGARRAP